MDAAYTPVLKLEAGEPPEWPRRTLLSGEAAVFGYPNGRIVYVSILRFSWSFSTILASPSLAP
jgi:hypothetical protein